MQCYKIKLTLDSPLPLEEGRRKRREIDENTIDHIDININELNEKYHEKACVFIYHNTNKVLDFCMIINDKSSVDDFMNEITEVCDISGKYNFEEITVTAFERCKHISNYSDFTFERDILSPYGLELLTESYRDPPKENLSGIYSLSDIKKHAVYGLYADSFLPELERITMPSNPKNVYGHPVHYIVKSSCTDEICDRLISQLYKHGRLRSKRYLTFGKREFHRHNSFDEYFKTAVGCTIVISLHGLTDTPDDYKKADILSDSLFDSVKKYKRDTLVIFAADNSNDTIEKILANRLPEMTFIGIDERFAMNDEAKKILHAYCREDKIRADKGLLSAVATDTKYSSKDLKQMYDTWFTNALKTKVYPQYSQFKKNSLLNKDTTPEGSAYSKLKEMIGLENVKTVIDQAVTYSKMQKLLADRGMPNAKRSMHMVFTGAPGTAKTTVARLFARILKDNGVLSVGDLVECGRSDLVGKYVGWTAVQVKEMFKKAKGSVLFIDEAYSLVDDKSGMYGDEAINTIVQEMENNREDMIVIFAGYPDEMRTFIERNPGLRSRISFYVDFENYSVTELYEITKLIAKNNGYKLSADVEETLMPIFKRAINSDDFGNGRFARKLVEHAQLAQAVRLSKYKSIESLTGDDIITLCAEDFSSENTDMNKIEKVQTHCIGFNKAV